MTGVVQRCGGRGGKGVGNSGHAMQNLLKVTPATETLSNTTLAVGTGIFLCLSKPPGGRNWRSREGKQRPKGRLGVHLWGAPGGTPHKVWNSLEGCMGKGGPDLTHANLLPHRPPPPSPLGV